MSNVGKPFMVYPRSRFRITGETTNGKRFRMTCESWHYANAINLWRGSVWHILDGKRILVKRVWN